MLVAFLAQDEPYHMFMCFSQLANWFMLCFRTTHLSGHSFSYSEMEYIDVTGITSHCTDAKDKC